MPSVTRDSTMSAAYTKFAGVRREQRGTLCRGNFLCNAVIPRPLPHPAKIMRINSFLSNDDEHFTLWLDSFLPLLSLKSASNWPRYFPDYFIRLSVRIARLHETILKFSSFGWSPVAFHAITSRLSSKR